MSKDKLLLQLRKFKEYINDWNELDRKQGKFWYVPLFGTLWDIFWLNKKSKLTKAYGRYLDNSNLCKN